MKIPNHLKHKAVIVAEDYGRIDGPYAGHTEAQGLSLGLAQWNDRGNVDISAKVWRHTSGGSGEDGKWSRQSEELPLHRVLDLALLICKAQKHLRETEQWEKLYDPAQIVIGKIDFDEGAMEVTVNTGNERIDEDIRLFRDSFRGKEKYVAERLNSLARELKELGYEGK